MPLISSRFRSGVIKAWRACVAGVGSVLEDTLAPAAQDEFYYPPIFILGAPRCGSTLLMQVLTDAYDVGYLSNVHCRWFGAPGLAERLLRPLKAKRPSHFQSHYGRTKYWYEPAECGEWWYRFFPREPAYVSPDKIDPSRMLAFRRSLLFLDRAFDKPAIYKNLYATIRLEPIIASIPEAVFIVMRRGRVPHAQSILKGRMDALGTYEKWWSVPVPDQRSLQNAGAVKQVLGQIDGIYRLIDRNLSGSERAFDIDYETFCNDTGKVLERFEHFLEKLGINIERRFSIPANFSLKEEIKIPEAMYEELLREAAASSLPRKIPRGHG